MAKFYGTIVFVNNVETAPGVWSEEVTERNYYGDITKNVRRLESGNNVNDDISLNNVISIVADPFALQSFFAIRFVRWAGAAWRVTNVEVQSPRLILTIGGVYHEQA